MVTRTVLDEQDMPAPLRSHTQRRCIRTESRGVHPDTQLSWLSLLPICVSGLSSGPGGGGTGHTGISPWASEPPRGPMPIDAEPPR